MAFTKSRAVANSGVGPGNSMAIATVSFGSGFFASRNFSASFALRFRGLMGIPVLWPTSPAGAGLGYKRLGTKSRQQLCGVSGSAGSGITFDTQETCANVGDSARFASGRGAGVHRGIFGIHIGHRGLQRKTDGSWRAGENSLPANGAALIGKSGGRRESKLRTRGSSGRRFI